MIKFRVTYYSKEELQEVMKRLDKDFIILGSSRSYSCRNSKAKNIYLEIELKK